LTLERARYQSEILPRLARVTFPLRDLADALGLSLAYAGRIRSAEVIPHPMYYAALEALISRTL
jgi:hypothetical protein